MDVKSMLSRLIDFLKTRQITTFCADLTATSVSLEPTEVGISSPMDTWGRGETRRRQGAAQS